MYSTQQKVLDEAGLYAKLNVWRLKKHKLVFTNGCFDLIHLGHVDYLERARALGDFLIIGLNADESVSRLKGSERPIMPYKARSRVLAAMEFVDAVTIFVEDTPYELIKKVQPDILVKGGDYVVEEIVGYDIVTEKGGQVLTIPLTQGYSTTSTLEKINKL